MVWAAVGAAAVGVLGGAVVSNLNNKAADARASAASAGGSQNSVTAADPFADQRFAYQNQLQALMAGGGTQGNAGAQGGMNAISAGGPNLGSQQALSKMNSMLNGTGFTPSDPSYQFRLQQGTENLNRGAAKSGLLDSGNRLAALQEYGQQSASQEYGAQFARAQANVGANAQAEQQQFQQLQAVDTNTQNQFANNYSRLAQLSGANTGSPSGASQAMVGQQAGAAATASQWGNLAVKGGQALWGMATDGGGGTWGGSTRDAVVGSGQNSLDNYTPGATTSPGAGVDLSFNW